MQEPKGAIRLSTRTILATGRGGLILTGQPLGTAAAFPQKIQFAKGTAAREEGRSCKSAPACVFLSLCSFRPPLPLRPYHHAAAPQCPAARSQDFCRRRLRRPPMALWRRPWRLACPCCPMPSGSLKAREFHLSKYRRSARHPSRRWKPTCPGMRRSQTRRKVTLRSRLSMKPFSSCSSFCSSALRMKLAAHFFVPDCRSAARQSLSTGRYGPAGAKPGSLWQRASHLSRGSAKIVTFQRALAVETPQTCPVTATIG